MNDEFSIVSCDGDPDMRKQIVDGLNNYNESVIPYVMPEQWVRLEFAAKNEKGELLGGILAMLGFWGGLDINILWVKEDVRKQGIGTSLIRKVEEIAKERGALLAMVNTFDFQGKEFYLKNGYTIIGEHKNFPGTHSRFYFEKRFQ